MSPEEENMKKIDFFSADPKWSWVGGDAFVDHNDNAASDFNYYHSQRDSCKRLLCARGFSGMNCFIVACKHLSFQVMGDYHLCTATPALHCGFIFEGGLWLRQPVQTISLFIYLTSPPGYATIKE